MVRGFSFVVVLCYLFHICVVDFGVTFAILFVPTISWPSIACFGVLMFGFGFYVG